MEATAVDYHVGLTNAENNYYTALEEAKELEFRTGKFACVGAGLGGGFVNTRELHVMKFNEAMASKDKDK